MDWPVRTHMNRIDVEVHDYCRSCPDVEAKEIVFHFLCQCSEIADIKGRYRRTPVSIYLDKLSRIELETAFFGGH